MFVNCFIVLLFIDVNYAQKTVSINISNGQINGTKNTVEGNEVNVFLGIPYAEPPIGNLRFKKPLPLQHQLGSYNATHWPNPCMQDSLMEATFLNKNYSEDCLYLNIWSPIDIKSNETKALKPVMFYIHGGGLVGGSSNQINLNGDILSSKGDVVVVTINYRLNVFGFLYSGTDDAPGNVGLWDQALALEWVNNNIGNFGGDPKRVTIFGQSAGSWSVSLLLLSQITRNMYKNAIMMSGAVVSSELIDEPIVSKTKWLKGAKRIGCTDEVLDKFTPKIIDCLKNMNANSLLKIYELKQFDDGKISGIFPVIDGEFLTDSPNNLIENKSFKTGANILIGTTDDEGSYTLPLNVDKVKYNAMSPQNLSYSEAYQELANISSNRYFRKPVNGEEIANFYFTEMSPNTMDYDQLRRTIGIAIGDYHLGCPTIHFAKQIFKNDRNRSNVYQYYYNTKYSENFICSKWMGACHGSDLYPLFGLPILIRGNSLEVEIEQSLQVIQFFTDFAKFGYPSPQNGKDWPQYYTIDDNVIAPYFDIKYNKFRNGLKHIECEILFKRYFDL